MHWDLCTACGSGIDQLKRPFVVNVSSNQRARLVNTVEWTRRTEPTKHAAHPIATISFHDFIVVVEKTVECSGAGRKLLSRLCKIVHGQRRSSCDCRQDRAHTAASGVYGQLQRVCRGSEKNDRCELPHGDAQCELPHGDAEVVRE